MEKEDPSFNEEIIMEMQQEIEELKVRVNKP